MSTRAHKEHEMVTVASFTTESAAWLASARIAANGQITTHVSRVGAVYVVLAQSREEADAARAILALFN